MPFEAHTTQESSHSLTLENRRSLTISGVEDVERFDETAIVLSTGQEMLTVQGSGLHIEQLSLDGGELKVEGLILALSYEEPQEPGSGFFARLFH